MESRHGRRLGLGPVFAYEWIAWSRRWQWYATRSLFAGMLLAALLVILATTPYVPGGMNFRALAKLGESFYIAIVGTQLTLVLVAAPAATAGAVCSDRASGMLTHVLVTDLSDAEIVLGKLAARLVPVLGLVACALPLMAIMTMLGGVDPVALFGAFLVTCGVAVLGSSLAFAFSVWAKKTHEALLGTYAVWGIWLVGRPFVGLMNSSYGLSLPFPSRFTDPYFLAFAPYWYPNSIAMADYAWFLTITLGASGLLAGLALLRLRAVCTRVVVPKSQSSRGRWEKLVSRCDPARFLPSPSVDFNPVLWREWHRGRSSRVARFVNLLFVVGAIAASVGAIISPRNTFAIAWVNGLQVSIGMLLLSVMSATSLAEERARGSLDVLMATRLSTREIVMGKWLGTFRLVPGLAILPVLVVLSGDPTQPTYFSAVILTYLFVIIFGAAITGLGLLMATWFAKLGRAVAITVTIYVLMAVGWLFVAIWFQSGPSGDGIMMASPFFFEGVLAADLCSPNHGWYHIVWGVVWLMFYAMAAVWLLATTLTTFNRSLGRIEFGILGRGRWRPTAAKPARIEEISDEAFLPI